MSEPVFGRILIPNCRLSYFHGFQPWISEKDRADGKQPKYSTKALLPKDDKKSLAKIKATILQVRVKKWGQDFPQIRKDRFFITDGEDHGKPEYKDFWVLGLNSIEKPDLILPNKKDATSQELYSGVWAHVIFDVWAQDNQHGKRINAGWKGAMHHRHDEAWSGIVGIRDDEWGDYVEGDEWEGEKVSGDDWD